MAGMKNKKPKLPKNVFMQDEFLETQYGNMGSLERISMAQIFERWAKQLKQSAFKLDAKGITVLECPSPLCASQALELRWRSRRSFVCLIDLIDRG
jgi:hypothetical protein